MVLAEKNPLETSWRVLQPHSGFAVVSRCHNAHHSSVTMTVSQAWLTTNSTKSSSQSKGPRDSALCSGLPPSCYDLSLTWPKLTRQLMHSVFLYIAATGEIVFKWLYIFTKPCFSTGAGYTQSAAFWLNYWLIY